MSWDTVRELFLTIPEKTIRRRAIQQRSGVTIKRAGTPPVLSRKLKTTSRPKRTRRTTCFTVPRARLDSWATDASSFSHHHKLLARVPQVISRARNQVRQENLYHRLNQQIKHAVERKLTKERVFDMEETGFGQKTKSRKVIAVRGSRNVCTKCIDMSFHLMLVACVSASGSCLWPLFLLPGQHLNRDILSECSGFGTTLPVAPKTFKNRAIFVQWLEHIAASLSRSIARPLLIIYDGCASHYSTRIVEMKIERKIILLVLPPNSTLLCSMDRFMIDEDVSSFRKKQAISLAPSKWQNGVLAKTDNVISGFANTGLSPISAPTMRQCREFHADGSVKDGSVTSNPVWLTVRQELRPEELLRIARSGENISILAKAPHTAGTIESESQAESSTHSSGSNKTEPSDNNSSHPNGHYGAEYQASSAKLAVIVEKKIAALEKLAESQQLAANNQIMCTNVEVLEEVACEYFMLQKRRIPRDLRQQEQEIELAHAVTMAMDPEVISLADEDADAPSVASEL
uniref:PREDICTED: similar to ENSANGP00000028549 putative n=1 Tax=Albugo laibachii Nc14 TaxID=890382 RepID=F0WDV5_9STRA|nr:PREDICTED: similar to ENSANGP00000028549 putative [Albugo laibachii Nc14]|eukprot:CCA19383.1 PREDICTED: similar to ENSANGP00000028549 putative [Albugo laibachii Nc14]